MGKRGMLSTFTMQQTGFQPLWGLLYILSETVSLWILLMTSHLNPPRILGSLRITTMVYQ